MDYLYAANGQVVSSSLSLLFSICALFFWMRMRMRRGIAERGIHSPILSDFEEEEEEEEDPLSRIESQTHPPAELPYLS